MATGSADRFARPSTKSLRAVLRIANRCTTAKWVPDIGMLHLDYPKDSLAELPRSSGGGCFYVLNKNNHNIDNTLESRETPMVNLLDKTVKIPYDAFKTNVRLRGE